MRKLAKFFIYLSITIAVIGMAILVGLGALMLFGKIGDNPNFGYVYIFSSLVLLIPIILGSYAIKYIDLGASGDNFVVLSLFTLGLCSIPAGILMLFLNYSEETLDYEERPGHQKIKKFNEEQFKVPWHNFWMKFERLLTKWFGSPAEKKAIADENYNEFINKGYKEMEESSQDLNESLETLYDLEEKNKEKNNEENNEEK